MARERQPIFTLISVVALIALLLWCGVEAWQDV